MISIVDDGSPAHLESLERSRSTNGSYKKRQRRVFLIRVGIVFLGLLVACGAAAGTLSHQASEVQAQLNRAMDLVPELRADLSDGDRLGAQTTFDQMQRQISAARSTATGPLWKAASMVPMVGPNFSAVSEVAVSADDVASRAIEPLLGEYESLDWEALSPTDGKVDIAQLQEAAPTISSAANTVKLSYKRLAAIDQSSLVPQVADPIRSATEHLRGMTGALGSASSASQLLPAMLGTDGPRNYLVLVQNNAEARATGGIPGALAILSTADGQITMGEQSSAGALGAFSPPIAVDAEQEAIYTARLGTQMQNANLTPDFPTAALTAKRMWEERHVDQSLDGVIALDPVVLGNLLEATGPVTLSDSDVLNFIEETSLPKSLTKDNVVSTLLSDVYREIEDPAKQDVYFASVAGHVFKAFTSGEGDSVQLLKALTTSATEDRLFLWSSHPDEQDIIASTSLVGSVVGSGAAGASFGVYFNDGTGAKMDYYATRTVRVIQGCHSNGYGSYTVRVNVANNAPPDAASSLPAYVTGAGVFGVAPGRFRTNYVFYGPAQSFAENASVNGQPVPIGSAKHGQRPVGTVALELGPGETAELDIVFSRVVQDTQPRLKVTPGLEPIEKVVLSTAQTNCR